MKLRTRPIGATVLLLLSLSLVSCGGLGLARPAAQPSLTLRIFSLPRGLADRTLLPLGFDIAVVRYDARGTGPSGATFAVSNVAAEGFTKTDLALGSWTITVDAFNASGEMVGTGSTVVVLSTVPVVGTVVIQALAGNGTLSLVLEWPTADVTGPVISASLLPASGVTTSLSFSAPVIGSSSVATLPLTTLAAGYYTVQIFLEDGAGNVRFPCMETVRIIKGKTTSHTFSLSSADLALDAADTPSFSVAAGSYDSAQSLTMSCATANAQIRYTIDGSPPSATIGEAYLPGVSAPIQIIGSCTLRAVSYATGLSPSPVATATYSIADSTGAPTVNPFSGVYFAPISVTLLRNSAADTLVYTTDGSDPVPGSHGTVYADLPIAMPASSTTTLKAVAWDGLNASTASNISVSSYQITGLVADPVFSLAAGTYAGSQSLTLSCSTAGASFRYKKVIGGVDPSSVDWVNYSGSITVNTTMIVYAYSYRTDWGDSPPVSSGLYNLP